jgi:hypothetical protein
MNVHPRDIKSVLQAYVDRELAPAARGFATVFEGMWRRRSEKPMREKE